MMPKFQTDAIGMAVLIFLVGAWFVFALIFLLRKKAPNLEETKRAAAANLGIGLQGAAFGIVWTLRRAHWWPFPSSTSGELALAAAVVALAWLSNFLCWRSLQTLGKQWTVRARVVQGHELITNGPYAIVRNPIYLGMFGLMVATGLAVCRWWALVMALFIFLVGNWIRIRAEERLLREAFGSRFDDYARRVPAFVPSIYGRVSRK
jgi:protein-S-isoprenylcysteine O-methyltransferase Ste14